jgi:NADH-quinone oxidoreductase subunit M
MSRAVTGGVIALIAHGLVVAPLFLLVGMLEDRLGRPLHLRDLGGLARSAPGVAGALTLLGMAALGLPGLATFPAELLMLVGVFHYSGWLAIAGAGGLVLAAVYVLRLVQLVLHGPAATPAADLRAPERWLLAPFAALLLLLGLYPHPVPALAGPAVTAAAAVPGPAQGGNAP